MIAVNYQCLYIITKDTVKLILLCISLHFTVVIFKYGISGIFPLLSNT